MVPMPVVFGSYCYLFSQPRSCSIISEVILFFFLVSWKQMSKVTIAAAAQICVIVCKSGREFNRWILVFTRTISHSLYVSLTLVLSANIFPQLIPFSIRFGSAFVRFYLEHFRLWNETSILFNKIGLCERWI